MKTENSEKIWHRAKKFRFLVFQRFSGFSMVFKEFYGVLNDFYEKLLEINKLFGTVPKKLKFQIFWFKNVFLAFRVPNVSRISGKKGHAGVSVAREKVPSEGPPQKKFLFFQIFSHFFLQISFVMTCFVSESISFLSPLWPKEKRDQFDCTFCVSCCCCPTSIGQPREKVHGFCREKCKLGGQLREKLVIDQKTKTKKVLGGAKIFFQIFFSFFFF